MTPSRCTPPNPPRIGLTGGIGSGKTTLAGLFAERGACLLDADVLARELVEPGQPAFQAIANHFGATILKEGRIDRASLKSLIFTRADERQWLDELLHPLVYQALDTAMMQRLADPSRQPPPYFLLVIPLLIETARLDEVDRVLVADCPESLQRERVIARDQLPPPAVERIIQSQCSRAERLALADDVIDTRLPLRDMHARVNALHQLYSALTRPGTQTTAHEYA